MALRRARPVPSSPLPDPDRTLLPRLLLFGAILTLLQQEADGAQPGAQAIFTKIIHVFVAQASLHILPADSVPGLAPAVGYCC